MKKGIFVVISVLALIWGVIFVSSLNGSVGSYPIETVLSSISGNYRYVLGYIDGSWKFYAVEAPGVSTLKNMSPIYGYWIYVNKTGGVNLTINGTLLTNTTWHLREGWNLIGYPSITTIDVATALSNISGNYRYVLGYIDGSWKFYAVEAPGVSTLKNLTPGYGYWIYVNKTGGVNLTI
ncbi:MAG: hypothetical protein QXY62_05350 [Candidatus Altiarchaeota archaeon]